MKCKSCGNEITNESFKFCTRCGAKLDIDNNQNYDSQNDSVFDGDSIKSEYNSNNISYNMPDDNYRVNNSRQESYNYNTYYRENNKSNKSTVAIIIAVVASILALVAIAIATFVVFDRTKEDEKDSLVLDIEEFEDFMEENLPDVDFDDTENRIDSDYNNVEIVTEPPTEATTRESTYNVYLSDVSWQEAHSNCAQVGGHLVTIESQEEFDKITSMLSGYDTKVIFYVGAARSSSSNEYYWVNKAGYSMGESINLSPWWLTNEPSFYDNSTGYDETAVCLLYSKKENRWVLNDIPNDYLGAVPGYRGESRVAYICEFG